jgi:MoxR-like ATPase
MDENQYFLKKAKQILQEVRKSVIGKDEIICKIMMAILAKGHVLIEDIPGVGKTTMTLAFAKTLGLECNRIQFTPDVMPSDVTGFNMFNRMTNQFEYKPGAVMCNILLADEINRTSPKTQSALLEVMEEGHVTVDGVTYELPNPFIVMATQNPFGSIGTQRLPESQMDRFMIRVTLGYPTVEDEMSILKGKQEQESRIKSENVLAPGELNTMRSVINAVHVDDSIYRYVAMIAEATRNHREIIQGISPRGSIAIIAMAKADAFLRGHNYVLPSDVQYILKDVIAHRMILDKNIINAETTENSVIDNILKTVKVPEIIIKEF